MARDAAARCVPRSPAAGALLLGLLAAACAHFDENVALGPPPQQNGYRFSEQPLSDADKDTFVVLTLSGGGTRAAALSFAVMRELARTPLPGDPSRSLLDEVDVISSVSGGSFAAAAYGLYGQEWFLDEFERHVVRRDIQARLFWGLMNPLNWPLFMSSAYDRIDMAGEDYGRTLFDDATFADLAAARAGRPFIILNSTDMGIGARFEFTQDQFDLLNSDLSEFPLGRAVAASSAFPGLLSPVRLVNHPDGAQVPRPRWIDPALESRHRSLSRWQRGRDADSYLRLDPTEDEPGRKARRYIHLLDGGISDNIGLRGTLSGLQSGGVPFSLKDMINREEIRRLVIIVVDAKTAADTDWDTEEGAPKIAEVLMTVATKPMDNFSAESVHAVSDFLELSRQEAETDAVLVELEAQIAQLERELAMAHGDDPGPPDLPDEPLHAVDFHFVYVSFEDEPDPGLRRELLNLPTTVVLKPAQIDLLLEAGPRLLRRQPGFVGLMQTLEHEAAGAAASAGMP